MTRINLSELKAGESAFIEAVEPYPELKRRLWDLGIVPGSKVCCVHIAPAGTPIAFWVKGALIALRKSDCRYIIGIRCHE